MRTTLIRHALRRLMENQGYYALNVAERLQAAYKLIFEGEGK